MTEFEGHRLGNSLYFAKVLRKRAETTKQTTKREKIGNFSCFPINPEERPSNQLFLASLLWNYVM